MKIIRLCFDFDDLRRAVPPRVPNHTSILTGAIYFTELVMETENEARFRNCARMGRDTF